MNRSIPALATAALMTMALATGARAEDTTVHIALLDMTAIAPGFVGQEGAGMMGHSNIGMMGRGGFGQGMMGGYGQQGNGPGVMGGHGQGYGPEPGMGMMGPGMMSIRADVSTVKAGTVTFDVTNWSRSIVHEMLVIAVDSPDAALPYDYSKQEVVEDQVKMLGETDELQPNASKTLTLDLPAGNYLLICNVPGHYGSGMQTPFKVS
jgi:uncharacterized cupredoxin-like copper-binding protein